MPEITSVSGTAIPLLLDDIDTDRIIPARFLRCVTFEGLGEHAFEDDRKERPGHPFDEPAYHGAKILIAGRNFGCGSSREHAPQSLMRWGIEAIVAESFAEIFFGNCTSLGVPCVTAARPDLKRLAELAKAEPNAEFRLDLDSRAITVGEESFTISLPDGPRKALMTGQYDSLSELLKAEAGIEATASQLPYMAGFSA